MKDATKQRLLARIEALEECAGHLDLSWTDDATERQEGDRLGKRLRAEATRLARTIRLAEMKAKS